MGNPDDAFELLRGATLSMRTACPTIRLPKPNNCWRGSYRSPGTRPAPSV